MKGRGDAVRDNAGGPAASGGPLLRLRGVSKAFGATQALDRVDFTVRAGEIHALIGENGAGKSTLMKVLSGVVRPDCGDMVYQGSSYRPRGPADAQASGVAMIYQELNLAPDLSARANLMLGLESGSGAGLLDGKAERQRVEAALRKLGHEGLDTEIPVHRLSVAEQQVVEIARACLRDVRVLILDEPTSSLGRADIERLFGFLRELRTEQVAIVYISHFLEECRELADCYTVLRDGQTVADGRMEDVAEGELVRCMVGRSLGELYPRVEGPGEKVLFRLESENELPLSVRSGEILGLAGLVGAGRTRLLRELFGLESLRGRTVSWPGRALERARPADSLRAGVGLLSEDRKAEGLLLNRPVSDNLLLTNLTAYRRRGLLARHALLERTRHWMRELKVKTAGPEEPVGRLSGGNQQKVALGRLLEHDTEILLLDEPTRGIDVNSKRQIYERIAALAASGKGVILASSYLPELLGLSHVIAVLRRGRIVAVRPRADWTESSLLSAAIGGEWNENRE